MSIRSAEEWYDSDEGGELRYAMELEESEAWTDHTDEPARRAQMRAEMCEVIRAIQLDAAADMRERAASACDRFADDCHPQDIEASNSRALADAIRELPLVPK